MLNEFISFWIETRVDGVHCFNTFIDFPSRAWYLCPGVEGPTLIRGSYDPALSDEAIEEFVKRQVDEALAAGHI